MIELKTTVSFSYKLEKKRFPGCREICLYT